MFGAFQPQAFQTDFQQVAPVSQDAGRARRRYFIEIDGEVFWVKSEEQARKLLLEARESAQAVAELTAKRQRLSRARIAPPKIRGSKALERPIAEARAAIEAIFKATEIDYELYQLLTERLRHEDDEEVLLLL